MKIPDIIFINVGKIDISSRHNGKTCSTPANKVVSTANKLYFTHTHTQKLFPEPLATIILGIVQLCQ